MNGYYKTKVIIDLMTYNESNKFYNDQYLYLYTIVVDFSF